MASVAAPERTEGRYERLCWERHARDLALAYPKGMPAKPTATRHPKGYWFDPGAGEHVITFVEGLCKHSKGEWAGRPLLLEEWQREVLRVAFGWMRSDGTRRFRIVYVEIPRKNGKSELAAALGLYLLVADQEPGAEVYSSATKKDQAKIVHDTATAMVRASGELKRWVKVQRNNLSCERLGSKFAPLSADAGTLDGLNPHGNIVDELHAHRDRGVWDVLDTAMGARRQPLTIAITTAGVYEPESIGWQQHEHAVKVLDQAIEDDAFFAFIACADAEDDWTAPETWAKANPNFGISVKPEYLEGQAAKALTQPSFTNTFLRLHLNRWTQQQDRWLSLEAWNACDVTLTPAEMREREASLRGARCFAGLDLSTKIDISALALWFPEALTLVCRFWCPEERIMERARKDRVPYDVWQSEGWLTATSGSVIDYDVVRADIDALGDLFAIQQVAFDPWNASQLATQLTGDGFTMVETRQGYKTLSEPSKEFEKLITARTMRHGGNPVMRWMVSNVGKKSDENENIRPVKTSETQRIDGVVATIMALSRSIVDASASSVYEERGIQYLGDD